MPDSQSRLTILVLSVDVPVDSTDIDSGGNVNDLVFARECSVASMLPGEAELVSEWTGLPGGGGGQSVKRSERSNGLDSALCKTTSTFLFTYTTVIMTLNYPFKI